MGAPMDPRKKEEAARLWAAGWSATDIARRLRIHAATIRGWRRNDAGFRELLGKHAAGLYAQGLLEAARRGEPAKVKVKAGATSEERMHAVRAEAMRLGRKAAARD